MRLQDSRDLAVYLSHRIANNFRLNIYDLQGFSERNPDRGSSINLRYFFYMLGGLPPNLVFTLVCQVRSNPSALRFASKQIKSQAICAAASAVIWL